MEPHAYIPMVDPLRRNIDSPEIHDTPYDILFFLKGAI
jgi:hypothetical protein